MVYSCAGISAGEAELNVTMAMYRDKFGNGAGFDEFASIGVYRFENDGSYTLFTSVNEIPYSSIKDFSYLDDPFIVGDEITEFESAEYSFSVSLPTDGSDFLLAYQRCCRVPSTINTINPLETGIAIELYIYGEGLAVCNRSPYFSDIPPSVLPNGENIQVPLNIMEEEGDELVVNFCEIKSAGGTLGWITPGNANACNGVSPWPEVCLPPFDDVVFIEGQYSSQKPFGLTNTQSINQDDLSMDVTFSQFGLYNYGLCIDEYRNGILLSKQILDYTIAVIGVANSSVIKGLSYWDKNGNEMYDTLIDQTLPFLDLIVEPFYFEELQSADASFAFNVGIGEYSLSLGGENSWEISTHADVSVTTIGDYYIKNVGFLPALETTIFELSSNSQLTICNEITKVWLEIENRGTMPIRGLLSCSLDKLISYSGQASITPDQIEENKLSWLLTEDLQPGEKWNVWFNINNATEEDIGEQIEIIQSFEDIHSGILKADTVSQKVLCSYDPNDKLVKPDLSSHRVLFETPLEYTIRFQNTGNFPASRVRIVDVISEYMDLNSFKYLGSSHDGSYKIYGNTIVFEWDIYLPDAESNEPESHGFVRFRLDPLPDLAEETTVRNGANIYFDNNPPIVTNLTTSIYVSELNPLDIEEPLNLVDIFPNPNTGNFTIQLKEPTNHQYQLAIFDLAGSKISSQLLVHPNAEIQLNKPSGLYVLIVKDLQSNEIITSQKLIIY